MRIRIDDEFDSDLEEDYKTIDKDLVVGNGSLADENIPIIEVNEINIVSDKDSKKNKTMSLSKEGLNNYNLENGFSIEIQGATLINTDKSSKEKINSIKLDEKNNIKEEENFEQIKSNKKEKLLKNELVKSNKVKEN